MPRLFSVEVTEDNIRIDEVNEEGKVLSTFHNTDITRFIEQNNITVVTEDKKATKKFKTTQFVIADDDLLEGYRITLHRHTSGTVNNITYD